MCRISGCGKRMERMEGKRLTKSADTHRVERVETAVKLEESGKQNLTTSIGASLTPDFRDKEESSDLFVVQTQINQSSS